MFVTLLGYTFVKSSQFLWPKVIVFGPLLGCGNEKHVAILGYLKSSFIIVNIMTIYLIKSLKFIIFMITFFVTVSFLTINKT